MPSAQTARGYRILRFLKRKPLPHKVIGETLAGDEVSVVVTGDSSAALADAINALSPCSSLKAKDKEGNLIRMLELEVEPEEPEEHATSRAGALLSIDLPKLVDAIARNIREASSAATLQQSKAYSDGFGAMVQVINLCLAMLSRLDQRIEQTEERLVETTGSEAPGKEQLVMAALQRAMGGQPGAPGVPTNGSNGAGFHLPPELIQSIMSQLTTPSEGDEPHGNG